VVKNNTAWCRLWWGKLKEGDHSGDNKLKWKDNIKMDLQEVGFGGMDWIDLA